ncbi:MAG TPA: PQQ-binding-like beta-propeller repeat protein, partial [Pyrinomonadaceae bacterium]|nr:PQQ-binding-like beta-propeller repeat protein [Pyrinomonadaceae bacterium]
IMCNVRTSLGIGILFVTVLCLLTSCNSPVSNSSNLSAANNPSPAASPAAPAVAVADGDWPGYNRTLDGQRYSPLNQITADNVGTLKQVCVADLGESGNFQSGIVVVNNTLYATTDANTYAYDPSTCQQKWKYHYEKPTPEGLRVNRGVAYADGKIFRGINAGYLIALDANSGKEIWETQIADSTKGESVPAAPIAWNGMVFIGQAGGDNKGVRGRMMAFNAADGKQIWSFDLVPTSGPGSDTWPVDTPDHMRTGGATWTSYSLDQSSGLLYVPAGNAAPDFDIKSRPGLNLYTNSLVILDAKTGAFKEYYQLTPNDFHDWDISTPPALIKTAAGKNIIVSVGKDGVVHGIDPSQKTEMYKTPIATQLNIDTPFTAQETRFCPGIQGGAEWNGVAFNPTANLVFANTIDWCSIVNLGPKSPPPGEIGKPYTGEADATGPFGRQDPIEDAKGWVTAVNVDDGSVKWKYQSPTPMIAAIASTGSGLIFTGDLKGDLLAFNATDGKQLLKLNAGAPIGGGVITYLANNKQYVAAAVGITSVSFKTKGGNARVAVFATP